MNNMRRCHFKNGYYSSPYEKTTCDLIKLSTIRMMAVVERL